MEQVWRSGICGEMQQLDLDGKVCFLVKISSDVLLSYVMYYTAKTSNRYSG
jgi:hypothetical protein